MADETGDLTPTGEETIAAEQERPDWLPAQFNDEQALVKSYNELQTKLGTQGSELGELRGQMEEMLELMQQAPAQPQYVDPSQNPLVTEYQRAYEEGDVTRMLSVQAQISQAAAQQVYEQNQPKNGDGRELDPYLVGQMHNDIASRYEADDAMKAKALEIMESHPLVAQRLQEIAADPNSTIGDLAPAVDTAYQLARLGVVSQEQQSLAQKQKEAEVARQRKIDAETLGSSGPTRVATPTEMEATWERIVNATDGGFHPGQ